MLRRRVVPAKYSLPTGILGVYQVAFADLDGDGALDIAVSTAPDGPIAVLRNHGDGSFGAPAYYSSGWWTGSMVIADMNRDGRQDFVIVNGENPSHYGPSTGLDEVVVMLGACFP